MSHVVALPDAVRPVMAPAATPVAVVAPAAAMPVVMSISAPRMQVRQDRASVLVLREAVAAILREGFVGPRGPQGEPGQAGAQTFAVVAAHAMTWPCIVAIVDGMAHYADAASLADMTSTLAVTTQAAVEGARVLVATGAWQHSEAAWAWPHGRVYLGDSPGQLAATPAAAAVLEVARVVDATTLDFNIQSALLRG